MKISSLLDELTEEQIAKLRSMEDRAVAENLFKDGFRISDQFLVQAIVTPHEIDLANDFAWKKEPDVIREKIAWRSLDEQESALYHRKPGCFFWLICPWFVARELLLPDVIVHLDLEEKFEGSNRRIEAVDDVIRRDAILPFRRCLALRWVSAFNANNKIGSPIVQAGVRPQLVETALAFVLQTPEFERLHFTQLALERIGSAIDPTLTIEHRWQNEIIAALIAANDPYENSVTNFEADERDWWRNRNRAFEIVRKIRRRQLKACSSQEEKKAVQDFWLDQTELVENLDWK